MDRICLWVSQIEAYLYTSASEVRYLFSPAEIRDGNPRDFSTSPDLRRASHKLLLSSGLMISNVEAMASAAVPMYCQLAPGLFLDGEDWFVTNSKELIQLPTTHGQTRTFPFVVTGGQFTAAWIFLLWYIQTGNGHIPHSLAQITHRASRFLFCKQKDERLSSCIVSACWS